MFWRFEQSLGKLALSDFYSLPIMPRIPYSVIWRACREDSLLPILLKECRTIDSARNELRWLREAFPDGQSPSKTRRSRLKAMCQLRSRGYPLQYILGNQPFGELEILCRKGVLIPRFVRPTPEDISHSQFIDRKLNLIHTSQSN